MDLLSLELPQPPIYCPAHLPHLKTFLVLHILFRSYYTFILLRQGFVLTWAMTIRTGPKVHILHLRASLELLDFFFPFLVHVVVNS